MEPKKGIDHEKVGTDVAMREDERRDITNNPKELPAKHRGDLAEDTNEVADEIPGARDDDGTESTG